MADPTDSALYELAKQRLLDALDLPAAEIEGWLATLERSDAVVARRVRQLLDAHRAAGTFLEPSATDAVLPEPAGAASPGTRIGSFVVERELGHGGMGTVLLGTRHEGGFIQRVAIKVIRGLGRDAHAAGRLKEERRILAALNHPLIAHFVDGGTTADGQPYLAMEYVEGEPITRFSDSQRLSQHERVRLFMRVCEAVHFAHQRLIVHRDIKPSNILVTADGTPKLLDFGIAKLIDPLKAPHVATIRVLTPFYASPEQAAGSPVTTSTDVYSLGVLLFELLTGSGPYRTVSPDSEPLAVLDAIRHELPERPSVAAARAQRVVDEDLDAIVLKALRKEESDRYGSVEQLTQDLARYLDGRPVHAHAESPAYRARKFIRRHRGAVAAASVAVVSLITAATVSAWQAQTARRERARADARFGDVRRLANAVVGPVYDAIARVPGSTAARSLLVKEALTYLDGLAAQAADDIDLKIELASAYEKIGDVQGNVFVANLGDIPGATTSYAKLRDLRTAVAAARPGPDSLRALAEAEIRVGDAALGASRFEDAISAYDRAVAVLARAGQATDERVAVTESRIYSHYGRTYSRAAKHAEAQSHLERALAVLEPFNREDASEGVVQALLSAHSLLGDVLYNQERFADALRHFEPALSLARTLVTRSSDQAVAKRSVRAAALRASAALAEVGRLDEAAVLRAEAMTILNDLIAHDPGDVTMQFDLAIAHQQQAMLHMRRADAESAFPDAATAVELFKTMFAAYRDQQGRRYDYAFAIGTLGDVEMERGNLAEAIAAYREAIEMMDGPNVDVPKRVSLVELHEVLGDALDAQAGKTGSADLRGQARREWIAARDGYGALSRSGDLPPSYASKPAELEKKLSRAK